jgi:hypothetical protein
MGIMARIRAEQNLHNGAGPNALEKIPLIVEELRVIHLWAEEVDRLLLNLEHEVSRMRSLLGNAGIR